MSHWRESSKGHDSDEGICHKRCSDTVRPREEKGWGTLSMCINARGRGVQMMELDSSVVFSKIRMGNRHKLKHR